ncbi:MAG: hypothetical protein U0T36_10940 [Saprospiraceae bacterium]
MQKYITIYVDKFKADGLRKNCKLIGKQHFMKFLTMTQKKMMGGQPQYQGNNVLLMVDFILMFPKGL